MECAHFPPPCLGGQRRAVIPGFSRGIRKPGRVICLDLSEELRLAKSRRQLPSLAFSMLFRPYRAFYQPRLCATPTVLGNHQNFMERQS